VLGRGISHAWEGSEIRTKVWLENVNGRTHLGDIHVDRRIILEWILEKWIGKGVNWIYMAQYGVLWWDLVNTVLKFGCHKRRGITWIAQ